jgi:isopenicillin-N epimerase
MTSTGPIAAAGAEFLLRPDVIFLNHGSFGACPRPVFETYQRWQRQLEAEPVEFLGRRLEDALRDARQALAAYLHTAADNLVFIPNATVGINIVARSLPLTEGDEVLGTDHEYGAAECCWRYVCQQRGARYRSQPIALPLADDDDDEAVVDEFWAGVTAQTRVIFLSHLTSPTALRFPVAALCQRARAAAIYTVIDGAHAPGQLDVHLDEIGADFYTGNCHKWLCAPKGSAFLFVRPDLQEFMQPLIVSWGYESLHPSDSRFQDLFGWTGTMDPAAYLSVPAAIGFQAEHDWPSVRGAAHALAREAQERVLALSGASPIAPGHAWSQMCSIPLPPCDPTALQEWLFREHHIEVPILRWNDQTFLRLSVQAYNTPADIDHLLTALKRFSRHM